MIFRVLFPQHEPHAVSDYSSFLLAGEKPVTSERMIVKKKTGKPETKAFNEVNLMDPRQRAFIIGYENIEYLMNI